MGFGVVLGLAVLLVAVAIVAGTVWYLREPRSTLPPQLLDQRRDLRARVRLLIDSAPSHVNVTAKELPARARAGAVEARLLAGDPSGALAAAERLLAEAPDDARVDLLMARVLVACDALEPAAAALERACERGADGPMARYLRGRIRHLSILRQTNATNAEVLQSPVPSLITPFEMFVLQLERQRQSSDRAAAVWLAGVANQTFDHERILAIVTEHFSAYYSALDDVVAAAEADPDLTDARYHAARLALKVGFVDEGRALLDRIEPLMAGSAEVVYYRRDLAQLRDESVAAQVSSMPAIGDSARRSPRLRVLS